MPDSTEFVYLVFHPNGRLYYTTSAAEIELAEFANRERAAGKRIVKLQLPSIEQLRAFDNGEPCLLVQP